MVDRVTGARNQLLDAGRGIAALGVVAYHAGVWIGPAYWDVRLPFEFGRYGVHFFFLISGYLITRLHWRDAGRPERLPRFAFKRVWRIYPTYWLVLAAVLAMLFLAPGAGEAYQRDPANIMRSALLVGDYSQPVLSVAWTLHHEMLFYALFGLLIVNRALGCAVLAIWLAACTIGLPGYVFSPINLLFGAGMLLAGFRLPEVNIGATMRLLGAASYSIYLVHYPVLGAAAKVLAPLPVWAGLPLALMAAAAAGVALHRMIECPILAFGRRDRTLVNHALTTARH